MSKLPSAFTSERQGKTLIISPEGDSLSFEESDIKRSLDQLHHLLDEPEISNLIVDVGSAPYLGSIIVGAIMVLCKKASDNGGKTAFCNASPSVLDSIQLMRLDSVIPYFATREEAMTQVEA